MSLSSSPAAEHMDAIYRYQRFIYDASRKYYLLGRDRMLAELAPPPGGTVLEVACGTGRNLIQTARRYPEARCCGFDISSAMLTTARASIARAGLEPRITVAEGDATDFSSQSLFDVEAFDRVFISYALSMIPQWRLALSAALAAVAPGGRLHIVDFGEQGELPAWFKRALRAWLAKFSVTPRDALIGEVQKLARERGFSAACEELYGGYATYAVIARAPA